MDPVPFGKQFVSANTLNTVVQIVAPASNTTGLIIRSCTLGAKDGDVTLYVDTSAPSSAYDGTKRVVFYSSNKGNSAAKADALPYPIYVDPGYGVWAAGAGTAGTSNGANLTWDLVDGPR